MEYEMSVSLYGNMFCAAFFTLNFTESNYTAQACTEFTVPQTTDELVKHYTGLVGVSQDI